METSSGSTARFDGRAPFNPVRRLNFDNRTCVSLVLDLSSLMHLLVLIAKIDFSIRRYRIRFCKERGVYGD